QEPDRSGSNDVVVMHSLEDPSPRVEVNESKQGAHYRVNSAMPAAESVAEPQKKSPVGLSFAQQTVGFLKLPEAITALPNQALGTTPRSARSVRLAPLQRKN